MLKKIREIQNIYFYFMISGISGLQKIKLQFFKYVIMKTRSIKI